jgi:hypothetical protein
MSRTARAVVRSVCSAWVEDSLPCGESESRPARFSQPIATITNPALISTVAAMDIAISSGVGLIQSLRMAVPSMV